MRILHTFALCAAAVAAMGVASAAGVKDGYASPTVVVPYAVVKPVIDGKIDDDEWRGAVSFNALQTTTHQVSARQTRFWMMWDEDNIYVAMRSPMRKGERPIQSYREIGKDMRNVVFDDSFEIWLDLGTNSPDGQPVFFQYVSNFAGAKADVMHEPAVGNQRWGWTSGWEPKNRLTADNQWEMEVAIPRKSLYKNTPFVDGFKMAGLLARNHKRPWEQNSFEGTGIFNVRDTYTKYVLSKKESAVHLLGVSDSTDRTFGLNLEVFGVRDETLKWSFTSDGGVNKEGTLVVKAGQLASVPAMPNLDKAGPGSFRVQVSSADGKTSLLDWCANREFGDLSGITQKMEDRGDQVGLSLSFNPVSNYIRVSGDFINYGDRGKIARSSIAVKDPSGKVISEKSVSIDNLSYVRDVINLGDIPNSDYTATMTCYDSAGKEVLSRESKFSKKDPSKAFPWWNTTAGNIEKVIDPWTPVTHDSNGEFGVWGRKMKVGNAGLPAQVTTQGIPLLARQSELIMETADGKIVRARPGKLGNSIGGKPNRAFEIVHSDLDDIWVGSTVTVEFDGMYKVDMHLTPKKPVKVKSLKVVVPLTNEMADYIHATGEGIRSGFYYGFLDKKKTGRIWDCRTVDSQPMLIGSFIPYLWVGNSKGGICWFADSDEGWVPNDSVPAIEIRRDGKQSTDLVLNLISSDFTIDSPRKITFAFQASPVKPMEAKWRMDSWWCGDTFGNLACHPDPANTIWSAIPFTLNTEKCRRMVDALHKSTAPTLGVDKYHANAVPYFIHISLPQDLVPEVGYFGDEWTTSVSQGLYYGKTLTDYMIYNLSKWCKETGIDGLYTDNMSPLACDNIDAGCGYRLPDGRVQPTYQMFDTRKYFLRMRAAFLENGKNPPKIVTHMTNNMILPWVGPADVAYDGEERVIYPEMGKDFMDLWPLDRIRADYSGQWGVTVNFMHEYQGPWTPEALKKAMRAYTGEVILHDALPSGNANSGNQELWIGRDRFGIEAADVSFIGYWEADSGLATTSKDVKLAGWLRPGKILIGVVNFGEKCDAKVTVNAAKLGLPAAANWHVWDAETRQDLSADKSGKIVVPVERHDYRQIIIEQSKR